MGSFNWPTKRNSSFYPLVFVDQLDFQESCLLFWPIFQIYHQKDNQHNDGYRNISFLCWKLGWQNIQILNQFTLKLCSFINQFHPNQPNKQVKSIQQNNSPSCTAFELINFELQYYQSTNGPEKTANGCNLQTRYHWLVIGCIQNDSKPKQASKDRSARPLFK